MVRRGGVLAAGRGEVRRCIPGCMVEPIVRGLGHRTMSKGAIPGCHPSSPTEQSCPYSNRMSTPWASFFMVECSILGQGENVLSWSFARGMCSFMTRTLNQNRPWRSTMTFKSDINHLVSDLSKKTITSPGSHRFRLHDLRCPNTRRLGRCVKRIRGRSHGRNCRARDG
jgi:hypothetical protein